METFCLFFHFLIPAECHYYSQLNFDFYVHQSCWCPAADADANAAAATATATTALPKRPLNGGKLKKFVEKLLFFSRFFLISSSFYILYQLLSFIFFSLFEQQHRLLPTLCCQRVKNGLQSEVISTSRAMSTDIQRRE